MKNYWHKIKIEGRPETVSAETPKMDLEMAKEGRYGRACC